MASNDDHGNENDSCNCDKNKKSPNFPVFTNPLDMERFFSQQMDELVKSFGTFGSFFHGFPEFPPTQYPGQLPNDQNDCDDENGSRDFMLRKGPSSKSNSEFPEYLEPRTGVDSFKLDLEKDMKQNQKVDRDLDSSGVNSEDLDKLYPPAKESKPPEGRVPFFDHDHRAPGSLFGQIFGYNSPFPDTMIKPQVIYFKFLGSVAFIPYYPALISSKAIICKFNHRFQAMMVVDKPGHHGVSLLVKALVEVSISYLMGLLKKEQTAVTIKGIR